MQQTLIEITEYYYKLCPDFGSIYKKMTEPKKFILDERLQTKCSTIDEFIAGMRANKQGAGAPEKR